MIFIEFNFLAVYQNTFLTMNKHTRLFLLAIIAVSAIALNVFGVMPVKATQVFLNTLLVGFALILLADQLINSRIKERS